MFDEYFQRKDVLDFIKELETNPKYRKMIVNEGSRYKDIKDELALYLFYDVVLKYKIIIDDIDLFEEFLNQIEKLFCKIDVYDDLLKGIQKLIIRYVGTKLDVQDSNYNEERREIATYIYDKYVLNGYFVHGFSSVYEEFISKYSFVPEHYPNRYSKMIMIQNVFAKYKANIMDKDFHSHEVTFTDDFIMGCNYSINSPGYFYQLLNNELLFGKHSKDGYLKMDYSSSISALKKYMNFYSFSESDKKLVLEIVGEEWNLLHREPRKVSLLFVKRNKMMDVSKDKLEDYLNSDMSLQEIVDCIFSSKYSNVAWSEQISKNDFQIVSLDDYYKSFEKPKVEIEKMELMEKEEHRSFQLLNSYGTVSVLIILGSLFITLGVLVSVIMILRGM